MNKKKYCVDIILPVALPQMYTYSVPDELSEYIQVGQRVIVQFGKQKVYSALVYKIHNDTPTEYRVKDILAIFDDKPIVNEKQFKLWEWIAGYYMCTMGEVMNAALPIGLKISSETKIIINPDFTGDYSGLTEKEYLIAETLANRPLLTLTEVSQLLEVKTVYPIIKTLIDKKVVLIQEELVEQFKPKQETYVALTESADKEENLEDLFKQLERAPKQLELLMSFVSMSKRYGKKRMEVKKVELLESVEKKSSGTAAFGELVKKQIFAPYKKEVSRLGFLENKIVPPAKLSEDQQTALNEIKDCYKEKDVALLHGVTSSGKTEIYVHMISEALKEGKQVLYLLPEIALTTQIIERLRMFFGSKVNVYHSRFGRNERVEVWNKILEGNEDNDKGKLSIVLGPRSAMFLPYDNLGLIIVDEEHDGSFKQQTPAPRYQARDTAIYLAKIHQAKVVLGSATPSIESYYNAEVGKYGLVNLFSRHGNIKMPTIEVVDSKYEMKTGRMKSHFSKFLLENIQKAIEQGEQVILFQNRRGFSTVLECQTCGWIPQCKHCDVSLTYHKQIDKVKCHYCGYAVQPPKECKACGDTTIKAKGFGTEKVEEELAEIFPKVKIARMDYDTTRSKFAYHNIITDFEQGKIDILVGTQMVSKGLDFDNVSFVGILNADNMINFPDFRAFEKSFSMMMQVSGRAGRKAKQGKVIIQTFNPEHKVIENVVNYDYQKMYKEEIEQRKKFKYPPFYRLIQITVKHVDKDILNKASSAIAYQLKNQFGNRILGPEYPLVIRVKNQYQKNILIKLEKTISIAKSKQTINKIITQYKANTAQRPATISIDVDIM